MKRIFRFIVLTLLVSIMICNIGCFVSATQIENENNHESLEGIDKRIILHECLTDAYGNSYGATNWGSLDAAKARYGWNWNYGECSVYYAGGYYNHYYCFSDGTKMYFGVI